MRSERRRCRGRFHPPAVGARERSVVSGTRIHMVVGTTGIGADGIEEIRRLAGSANANAIVAPNFAIGAALMLRFAEQAARYFDAAEVIELHHDGRSMRRAARRSRRRSGSAPHGPGAWAAPGGDGADPGARGADVEGVRRARVRLPGLSLTRRSSSAARAKRSPSAMTRSTGAPSSRRVVRGPLGRRSPGAHGRVRRPVGLTRRGPADGR